MSLPDTARAALAAEFRTASADEASAFLSRRFAATVRVSGVAGGNELRYTQAGAGPLRMDGLSVPGQLGGAGETPGLLCVVRLLRGRAERDTGGVSERFGPGDVFLHARPGEGSRSRMYQPDVRVTAVPVRLLSDVAGTALDQGGPVRFTGYRPVSAVAARQWRQCDDFARLLLSEPVAAAAPLLVSSIGRLLASTMLAIFPNTAVTEPNRADRHDAHPDAVRRAVAYIEAGPGRDMTVTDIARAAFVTPRAIQLAFRRHLGTTPMAYLRQVRLERARAELASGACRDSITQIAARWGFSSASRFAEQYRTAFGEKPSQTPVP